MNRAGMVNLLIKQLNSIKQSSFQAHPEGVRKNFLLSNISCSYKKVLQTHPEGGIRNLQVKQLKSVKQSSSKAHPEGVMKKLLISNIHVP